MVIDTTFAVDLIRETMNKESGGAVEFLRGHASAKLRMPVFVLCEIQLGVMRADAPAREGDALSRLTEFMEVVYPGPGFAEIYAAIADSLLTAGTPIPVMDALIAATAIQHSEPLVSRDTEHFGRVERLVLLTY